MSDSNIGQIATLIKAVKDMGGYESTREQLAAAIGEKDPNNVLVSGSVQSDWLLELSFRIDALERRIEQLENHDLGTAIRVSNVERKLNHKSIETSGESIKIADESIKIGGGE